MKKNLLILVIVIVIAALAWVGYSYFKESAKPIVWDGDYKMTGSLTCTGDIPNLTTIPMDSTVTVSNNKIVEEFQDVTKSFDIDKKGKASEVIEPTDFGNGVSASGKADYQFSKEGDAYKFTATATMEVSASTDGTTYSATCSGTVTGVKQ